MKESTRKKIAASIPAWIRKDYIRKLIAIFIAIVVLIAVKNQGQPQESTIRDVRVRFELPEKVRFQGNTEPKVLVRVTVKGKSSMLNRLSQDDVRIGRVSLNPEDVIFDRGFFYDDVEIINV